MVKFNTAAFFVPSGKELERATLAAIENIDRQLSKMPSVKKTPCATDNFPWIYNDLVQFRPHRIGNSENKLEKFI